MNVFDKLTGLIAPHICVGCGTTGSVLCETCMDMYTETVQPRCAGCKKLSDNFKVCASCKSWLPLSSIYVVNNYEGVSELLIRDMKFDSQRSVASVLARQMSGILPELRGNIICPIPTAPSRIRQRGFDHALLIAKTLSKQITVPLQTMLSRHSNVRQLGATRANRIKQMSQEFEINKAQDVEGKNILLVDDVFTTGATLVGRCQVTTKKWG